MSTRTVVKSQGSWIRQWIPPAVRRIANRLLGTAIVYRGPYPDFRAAGQATRGYEQLPILDGVRNATRQVMSGHARYQQDGTTFVAEPPADTALAGLLLAAARAGGKLSVLDFGGSLGSHFLRWLPLLDSLPAISWTVVEQPHFAEVGRLLFAAEPRIRFESSVETTLRNPPNAILASSVLQYLEHPEDHLRSLRQLGAEVIVVDRLPVALSGERRIMTQHLPAKSGGSSYPLHVFDRSWLEAILGEGYENITQFQAGDEPIRVGKLEASYLGSIWRRRP